MRYIETEGASFKQAVTQNTNIKPKTLVQLLARQCTEDANTMVGQLLEEHEKKLSDEASPKSRVCNGQEGEEHLSSRSHSAGQLRMSTLGAGLSAAKLGGDWKSVSVKAGSLIDLIARADKSQHYTQNEKMQQVFFVTGNQLKAAVFFCACW